MTRIVEPEILDELPPGDPRAARSRRDLRRINFWMGHHGIMTRALKENFSGTPKEIVEIGAGDGNFLLRVAEKTGWKNVRAILLDRQNCLSAETAGAISKIGWHAETIIADVFDWSGSAEIVIANLFIHHFDDARLAQLLHKISGQTKLFIAVETHRFYFPWPCAQTTRLIGCSGITVHDAEASIRGGFVRQEISALWPDKKNWQLTERRAGLFSHLFVAKKT